MAVVMSRLLRDGELAGTGAASEIPVAACLLARKLHAPDLTLVVGGVYVNPAVAPTYFAAGAPVEAMYTGDFHDVFVATEQGLDVMFYSGLQIDRFGNINLHQTGGPNPRRGPGLANTSFGHTARRIILWCVHHERRRLVDQVDFTSVVGHRWKGKSRSEWGIPNQGPTHLITNKMVFVAREGQFVPDGWYDGSSWEGVQASTGWTLPRAPVDLIAEPTTEELMILRTQVDPAGTLRRTNAVHRG